MNSILLRTVLAVLPLLGITLQVRRGFLYGAFATACLLTATLIFLALRFALPKAVERLSLLLVILILGVMGLEFFPFSSLLLTSLFLLLPYEVLQRPENWERGLRETLLVSLSFWALLTGHAFLTDLLGLKLGCALFQVPAGSYLFLGLLFLYLRGRGVSPTPHPERSSVLRSGAKDPIQ